MTQKVQLCHLLQFVDTDSETLQGLLWFLVRCHESQCLDFRLMVINNNLVVLLRYGHFIRANGLIIGSNDSTSDNVKFLLLQCPFTDLFL